MLAAIWMVFLADPLGDVLAAPTVTSRVIGVGGVAALATLFAWSLVRYWAGRTPTPRTAVLLVAGELVCVALIVLAAGQSGLAGLVFACVTAMIVASVRAGLVTVAALVLVLLVLPRVVPGWQPTDSLVLTAALASLAMFGFRQATERNRALHRTQEEVAALAAAQERDRIARDMHDILGHSLTVVSVKAELAGRLLHSDPEHDGAAEPTPEAGRARNEVAEIQTLVRSTLADMRGMVAGERQVTLAGELAAARSAFDVAGIAADLPGAVDEVAEEHRAVFAWALREGTTNVLRHAAARRAAVTLTSDALVIDDDGRGIHQGEPASSGGGGNGLRGLAERARAVGLVVQTGPSPLGGLRLAVRVPDDEAAQRGGEERA
ncbi:sensor histidine kinase [Promicromonospora panici]|uniref:sensor histidine kinase n=1 Tax=Promicromonospora panici TaxID=2219658 RepID=UPI0013ED2B64|nr:histidine kinase [Promicromonospora panici]